VVKGIEEIAPDIGLLQMRVIEICSNVWDVMQSEPILKEQHRLENTNVRWIGECCSILKCLGT